MLNTSSTADTSSVETVMQMGRPAHVITRDHLVRNGIVWLVLGLAGIIGLVFLEDQLADSTWPWRDKAGMAIIANTVVLLLLLLAGSYLATAVAHWAAGHIGWRWRYLFIAVIIAVVVAVVWYMPTAISTLTNREVLDGHLDLSWTRLWP